VFKYPRTLHLEGSRLQPGDEDLAQVPFERVRGRRPGSLDALRAKLKVGPGGDQGPAAAAYEQAREHLRARRDFVWNATNVSRQQRDICVGLAAAYHARVEIVALEAGPDALHLRNEGRAERVPENVLKKLKDRWEAPDLTEAHRVERVDTERFVD
jgi:predicted kinase